MLPSYTLEEGGNVKSVPTSAEIESESIPRTIVTDNNLISRIIQRVTSRINNTIPIDVDKFKIPGLQPRPIAWCSETLAIDAVLIDLPIGSFFVRLKQSVGLVAPNFT